MKRTGQQVALAAPQPLTIALIVALTAGFFLIRGFFSLIVAAAIVAYVFRPVYLRLLKRLHNEGLAAACTLLITLLVTAIPIFIVVGVTILQANTIVNDISKSLASYDINTLGTQVLHWVNSVLSTVTGGRVHITSDDVWAQVSTFASATAEFILDTIRSWVGGFASLISSSILFMYVFTGVLVHHTKLTTLFTRLNPLDAEISELYLARAGGMTLAMVRGQFIIAAIQGTWSAAVLAMVGVPYFAFFLLILTFMSIIPLGAGIITIPIGVINILLGNYWQGTVIILNHLLVVTNIDNVLKPKLVPKSVRLHPALLLLAIFAGLGIFGFLGLIIGPVIMILITSTIEVYLKVSNDKEASATEPVAKT